MIKVNNVIKEMETLAPICLKEDFDNVGLMVGDRNKEVKKIEKDIFELEERLSNLNNELLKEDVYMDINKANLIKVEIDIVSKDIEKKTLEWDEITKDM